jgi:lipopolysaccharide/colanic/teichoic acid biosynthesis glycosyltransferase
MNKLKKNIESNAAIFALGGMEIKIASALLATNDIPMLSITGTHKKADKERTLPTWSAKYMLWNVFAASAISIVSPVLFIISVFIFASSIRSSLFNNERSGDNEDGPHKIKIINMLRNIAACKNKYFNTDSSNIPGTDSARINISVTDDDEILQLYNIGYNESLFPEKGQPFSDKAELYERTQLEMVLVNPVQIMAWHISAEGFMLNRDNWVEREIKYSDIRLLNKNAVLFLKTFQHVLITKG